MKPYGQTASRRAFTLIELIVAVVLLALTASITIHYLVSASQLYALLLAQKQADSEVRDAVSRLRRESRLIVQTFNADSNAWTFSNTCATVNTCRWYKTDALLNNNRLATGIGRFALSYYDATNGLLQPLPLSTANCALIRRVALDMKATNSMAASELKVNFCLQGDLLK